MSFITIKCNFINHTYITTILKFYKNIKMMHIYLELTPNDTNIFSIR